MNRGWRVRVVRPHDDIDPDYHEWVVQERVRADCRGRLNRRITFTAWTRWRCNNPDCRGEALVPDDAIDMLIEYAVRGVPA